MKTISNNCQYTILMKNPRDKRQIKYFAMQCFDGQVDYFMESYNDATTPPYGYMVVDMTQTCPDQFRLRTNIIPKNGRYAPVIYYPK